MSRMGFAPMLLRAVHHQRISTDVQSLADALQLVDRGRAPTDLPRRNCALAKVGAVKGQSTAKLLLREPGAASEMCESQPERWGGVCLHPSKSNGISQRSQTGLDIDPGCRLRLAA